MSEHILLVDDDSLLCDSLSFSLAQSGYRVSTAGDAQAALALIECDPPELILLDINLPGMDGLQALPRFEARTDVPIIFLTARRRELDEVFGLELGAADYVTKPFALSVLLARIRAALRRSQRGSAASTASAVVEIGDLRINLDTHTVTVAGRQVTLSPHEFDLLHVLAAKAGRVVSIEDLLARVWGPGYEGESQTVYVYISMLREKLGEDGHHPVRIVTVHGMGYRLEAQEVGG